MARPAQVAARVAGRVARAAALAAAIHGRETRPRLPLIAPYASSSATGARRGVRGLGDNRGAPAGDAWRGISAWRASGVGTFEQM